MPPWVIEGSSAQLIPSALIPHNIILLILHHYNIQIVASLHVLQRDRSRPEFHKREKYPLLHQSIIKFGHIPALLKERERVKPTIIAFTTERKYCIICIGTKGSALTLCIRSVFWAYCAALPSWKPLWLLLSVPSQDIHQALVAMLCLSMIRRIPTGIPILVRLSAHMTAKAGNLIIKNP